jgi:transposase
MKHYIGIDISKATLDVYDGKKSYKFPNDKKGFRSVTALSKSINECIFIFEPTGVYSYALTQFCADHKIKVVTVGPKVARDFARSLKVRSKTDKIDAKVLYKYHMHIEPSMVKVPVISKEAIKIQEMLNTHEAILRSKQSFSNQIESTGKENKEVLKTLRSLIKKLESDAAQLFEKIEKLILKDTQTKQKYDAIRTIPAIGKKSALYLLAFFMKYPTANAKELTALMGLDPVMRESGMFQGKQRISKQGGEQLRTLMYMPTLSALRFNDRIQHFYQGLTSRAKSKKLAVMAAMRKLILMAFSIYKSGENYRPLEVRI